MSWSEFFPILDDEMVEQACSAATAVDRANFEQDFGVQSVSGPPGRAEHIVSISLFFKSRWDGDGEVGRVTEEVLKYPERHGLTPTYNPWAHYVQPILDHGPRLLERPVPTRLRVHLAADLAFLKPRLEEFAEVWLMRSSSQRSAPGMLWRFLPLDDHPGLTTVLDADLLKWVEPKLRTTEHLREIGLPFWRIPVTDDYDERSGRALYRTIAGCYWGAAAKLPTRRLLFAHRMAQKQGLLGTMARHPRTGAEAPIFGADWPDYGADEFFLNTAMYPRMAEGGMLTLCPRPSRSFFLLLDIEYATWANRNSMLDFAAYKPVAWGHQADEYEIRHQSPLPWCGSFHFGGETQGEAVAPAERRPREIVGPERLAGPAVGRPFRLAGGAGPREAATERGVRPSVSA